MGATPQRAQRRIPGAPDTTKPAQLAASAARTPTHAVTGPPAWENGRDTAWSPSGPPPLCSGGPQVTETVGVNPDPPAEQSQSVPATTGLPLTAGSPTGFSPFMNQY